MGTKGSGRNGKRRKTADESDSDGRAGDDRAGEEGVGPESGAGESGPEGGSPAPGRVSALLEHLARPPDAEPGEWVWPAVGSSINGRFDLLRELGRGGFGVVYEAFDRKLHRVVALKAIRPGPHRVAEARREALEREAEAAAHLLHPNIVTLFDLGTGEQGPFLVLEMLEGETLQHRLARGALPAAEALEVAVGVARALAHAHEQGVLHRDLKPSNVFLAENGSVKVLDFGLAGILGTGGMAGGTPGYMAPEQWRREPEDARTDVFALGVLLFEMLTGRLPYRLSQDRSTALDPGPPPALELPEAPPGLTALVSRTLSKDPAGRPRDGRAMWDALEAVQRSLGGGEARGVGRARRGRWPLATAVAAIAAAILWAVTRPPPEATREPLQSIPIVIADLTNYTGDPELDNLSGLLITSLAQSELLMPYTRNQIRDVLAQMGRGEAAPIDEVLGREVARHVKAWALLLPSINRLDDLYAVHVRAIDPSTGNLKFAFKEEGTGKRSVFALIDRVSDRIRREMREREAAVRESAIKLEKAVTSSLAAYQHYVRSQECMYRTSFGQNCVGELREALEDDPTFALAYYQLAVWEERHGGARTAQVAATEAAVRYVDRVPPKERMLIRAWKAHFDGKDDEALAVLKKLAEQQPQDWEAVWEAGDLLYHRSDFERAVPYFETLLSLDSAHGWGLDHLVHSLGALGRGEPLRARVATWSSGPQGPTTLHALSAAHAWLGDFPAAAAAALREGEVGGGLSAQEDLLFTAIVAGDYRGVERQLGALAKPGSPAGAIGYYALAAIDAYQGRRRQGLARFDALTRDLGADAADTFFRSFRAYYFAGDGRAGPVWEEVRALLAADPNAAAAHAVTLAYLGDLEHAAGPAAHLRPGSPRQQTYDAVVLWQRGERDEALRRLREISARSPFDVDLAIAPAYLHGDLAARSGADAEAVEALRQFRSLFIPTMMWRSWAYPRSLYLSAASLERMGRRAEALEQVDRLLDDWRGADPGLPLLAEARALRARLAPEPTRPGGT